MVAHTIPHGAGFGCMVDTLPTIHTSRQTGPGQVSPDFKKTYIYMYKLSAIVGPGVSSVGSGGFIPYPGYEFFRSDFWYFDLNSSTWNEITYPVGSYKTIFFYFRRNIIHTYIFRR